MNFGYQKFVEFDNGYTASIVSNDMSYGSDRGLFEIAILHGSEIVYDTDIAHGTIGFLDFQEVADTLKKIEQLPKR
jgi:hypothetical protein